MLTMKIVKSPKPAKSSPPLPIIIDCDPGIDDAVAILLACASPELRILGLTTVVGNRPLAVTTNNALRLLQLADRTDIPVHAGCARPLLQPGARFASVHGDDGVGGVDLPDSKRQVAAGHGVDVLIETFRREPSGTVTLVAIGPLTNVAMALVKAPDIASRIKEIVVMGGAVFVPGNMSPNAEFNFWVDPAAAHVVMSSAVPIALFGLDVTMQVIADKARLRRLHALPNKSGKLAALMIEAYAIGDPALHDPCTIAWLVDRTLFSGITCQMTVDYRPGPTFGQVIAATELGHLDPETEKNVQVMRTANASGVFSLLAERLARLP